MEMVTVTRSWRTDDPTEDVRPNAKRIGEAMQKLCVMSVARTTRRPMFKDSDAEGASHSTRHILWAVLITRERRELEALQIEGIAKRVLADPRSTTSCDSAVERAPMSEPAWSAAVVFDG